MVVELVVVVVVFCGMVVELVAAGGFVLVVVLVVVAVPGVVVDVVPDPSSSRSAGPWPVSREKYSVPFWLSFLIVNV